LRDENGPSDSALGFDVHAKPFVKEYQKIDLNLISSFERFASKPAYVIKIKITAYTHYS
jgi:hypothetical protein